jgi:hypothetical protein
MKAFALAAVLVALKAGDAAPSLAPKDVKDRALQVPHAGSAMLLSFASKSNGEEAGSITRAIRVLHPDVEVLSFIDLSGFPGFMRGMVKGKILGRQDGAVKEASDAFVKAGKTPPADLDARVHIIPDFDASSCKAYGAADTGHQVEIVVIGADGTVKALFTKTPTIADVSAAVDKALGSP